MVEDAAGTGSCCVRGGADGVRARACVCRGGDQLRCGGAVEDRPAADRVKTDRRDAERLARLLRLGEITAVRVPGPEEEAARDLVRAREDARGDLMRARHRLSKLLLRHGAVYDATAWTRGPRRVASQATIPRRAARDRVRRVLQPHDRREDQDGTRSTRRSPSWPRATPYVDVVERLVCLRGVSTLTAFALTVELGDWHRFRPESLGAFLGLTPSENSSGERRRQGGITKTGNTHAAGC